MVVVEEVVLLVVDGSRLFSGGTLRFLKCCHCLRCAPFYGNEFTGLELLMLIGACVLPEQRLMGRKPRSKKKKKKKRTQLLQEIKTKDFFLGWGEEKCQPTREAS